MTFDHAIRIQEKWKAAQGKTNCKHTQLFNHLMSENGEKSNSRVCLVCGKIYKGPPK